MTTRELPSPPPADWTPTADAPAVAHALRAARSVLLLTHAKPDGDAVGSTLALARSLQSLGIAAEIWYVGPLPRWLPPIAADTPHRELPPNLPAPPPASTPDALAVLDTGTWPQLSELRPWLAPLHSRVIVIDHHLHGDGDTGDTRLIRPDLAATTHVLAPVCSALLGLPPERFPLPIAEPLYLGLATDTGWFRLSNVKPDTLRLAASLLDAGVNHTRLYEFVEQQDSPSRVRLLARALSSLTFHKNGSVALMRLSRRDFHDAAADRNDTSGFADMALGIAGVQVAAVLSESQPSVADAAHVATKVSIRSKPGPNAVDVNAVTRALGGGGHARAAGARLLGKTIDDAQQLLLNALP